MRSVIIMKKRILFITQNLERTGSEMVLWTLLKNLTPDNYDIYVFCIREGELYKTLPKYIHKDISDKFSRNWSKRLFRRILKLVVRDPLTYQLNRIHKKFKADIWYVNTIAIPDVYEAAIQSGAKIVSHFHELPMAYSFISYNQMQRIIRNSDHIIGCSTAVCEKIKDMSHENVHLLHSFIDVNQVQCERTISQTRIELGYSNEDFIWAISGKTTLIKGIDFLIPLLNELPERTKILWIGHEEQTGTYFYVKRTIEHRFPGKVLFIGEQKKYYYDYLNCANGFLLLSREDSFPLVMIEAAALGKPIVGFNSGGVKEFVDEDMGIVVDSWSVQDLAKALNECQSGTFQFNAEMIRQKALVYDISKQVGNLEIILNLI